MKAAFLGVFLAIRFLLVAQAEPLFRDCRMFAPVIHLENTSAALTLLQLPLLNEAEFKLEKLPTGLKMRLNQREFFIHVPSDRNDSRILKWIQDQLFLHPVFNVDLAPIGDEIHVRMHAEFAGDEAQARRRRGLWTTALLTFTLTKERDIQDLSFNYSEYDMDQRRYTFTFTNQNHSSVH